ncbi:hypothetical protein A2U01_0077753 [Trifolium medium]|uniref:Uncharacterized protein n=1 Tax=Trifolium medium TaxID=97028 RepID=A0A392T6U0_9FABA|nr:hypothetical protein [Trifolium medium]
MVRLLESVVMARDRTVVVRECVDRSNCECGSITIRVVVAVVGSNFAAIGSNDEL